MIGRKIICPNCSKNVAMPSSPFGVGRIIGDFIIEEKIGEGSIGTVYLAHQASLDRKVALKILSEAYTNSKGMSSFLSEARAAAKLSHPNLVQCFGVGDENGICFMAMNYIKGQTLKEKIKANGKIEMDEALHITQQVAEALYCAWEEARLIHRDVKPENIMVDDDGIVKLTDLGLAMPQTSWHENMEISGSPSYMSPEQFIGEKLDTRSDIYSLGVSLYQMLSGKLPFAGKTLNTVARQHFKEKALPINKIVPTISRTVSDLVAKMMAKKPDDRFKDMDELLQQIWKVRQNTAPEKELVPNVHTVTMKKLDYDLQIQSKARKIQIMMSENEEKSKSDIIVKIIAFTIPFLVLAIILLIAIFHQNDSEKQASNRLLENIEAMFDNEDISLMAISEEFENAKKSLNHMKEKPDENILLRLKLCAEKIENIRMNERNRMLEIQSSSFALRLHDLETKEQDSNKLSSENKDKDKKIKQFDHKFQTLEKELKKERELVQNLKNTLNAIQERDFAAWCDDLCVKTAILIRNGRFPDAKVVLKMFSEGASEKQKNWIDEKKQEIEVVEKLFDNIENSGQRFAGISLKEGKLKEIIGANVSIISSIGILENTPWKNLSIESLKLITPPGILTSAGEKLPYYFAMLNGRFSDAAEMLSKNSGAKNNMLAIRKYIFENIKYLVATDRKKATARTEDFLRDFSGTEDMDKLKNELNSLLKEIGQ
jgi:serine/threonine protein kinase